MLFLATCEFTFDLNLKFPTMHFPGELGGITRAFMGGQLAHLEDQIEEESEEKWGKWKKVEEYAEEIEEICFFLLTGGDESCCWLPDARGQM